MRHATGWFMLYDNDRLDAPLLRLDGTDMILYELTDISESVIRMFSTGIADTNGEEIFEGDIVEFTVSSPPDADVYVGAIIWNDAAFEIQEAPLEGGILLTNYHNILIIGNIYENPEILEVNQL